MANWPFSEHTTGMFSLMSVLAVIESNMVLSTSTMCAVRSPGDPRNSHEVARAAEDDDQVKELVVAEDLGPRIGAADEIDDGSKRQAHAAAAEQRKRDGIERGVDVSQVPHRDPAHDDE